MEESLKKSLSQLVLLHKRDYYAPELSAVFSEPNGESRPVSLTLTCDKNGNVR